MSSLLFFAAISTLCRISFNLLLFSSLRFESSQIHAEKTWSLYFVAQIKSDNVVFEVKALFGLVLAQDPFCLKSPVDLLKSMLPVDLLKIVLLRILLDI